MSDIASLLNALAGPPIAYDRRLRIPIHINPTLDQNTGGSFSHNNDRYKYTNPGRIDLASHLQKAWQEGEEEFPKKALKHEIIHGLQKDTFWHAGKPWEPELNTPRNSLLALLTSFLNPQTKLDNAKNKILKLSKDPIIDENNGKASDLDYGAFINSSSEWIPWLLTDTLPKELKDQFTAEEKELLKNHISNSFTELTKKNPRYNTRNLESIWK